MGKPRTPLERKLRELLVGPMGGANTARAWEHAGPMLDEIMHFALWAAFKVEHARGLHEQDYADAKAFLEEYGEP